MVTQSPPSRSQYSGGSAPVVGDELGEGGVGDRRAVDLEGVQLDRVPRTLVVVGEAVGTGPDVVRTGRHRHHLGSLCDRLAGDRPVELDRLVAVDHLQELQHRLVVLVLVRDQHLVDEAAGEHLVVGVLELDPSSTSMVRARTSAM